MKTAQSPKHIASLGLVNSVTHQSPQPYGYYVIRLAQLQTAACCLQIRKHLSYISSRYMYTTLQSRFTHPLPNPPSQLLCSQHHQHVYTEYRMCHKTMQGVLQYLYQSQASTPVTTMKLERMPCDNQRAWSQSCSTKPQSHHSTKGSQMQVACVHVHVHVPAKGAHPHTKTGLKRTYCTDSFLSQSSLSQGYGSAQALCHKVHTCQSMCHRHALFLMSTKRAHTPSSVQVSQPCRFLAAAPPPVSCNMLAAQLLSSSS